LELWDATDADTRMLPLLHDRAKHTGDVAWRR
jgi:hypothetical protein